MLRGCCCASLGARGRCWRHRGPLHLRLRGGARDSHAFIFNRLGRAARGLVGFVVISLNPCEALLVPAQRARPRRSSNHFGTPSALSQRLLGAGSTQPGGAGTQRAPTLGWHPVCPPSHRPLPGAGCDPAVMVRGTVWPCPPSHSLFGDGAGENWGGFGCFWPPWWQMPGGTSPALPTGAVSGARTGGVSVMPVAPMVPSPSPCGATLLAKSPAPPASPSPKNASPGGAAKG